ncbi:hypothetical protein V8F33_013995 [Rhypophila sp. PSN 637]
MVRSNGVRASCQKHGTRVDEMMDVYEEGMNCLDFCLSPSRVLCFCQRPSIIDRNSSKLDTRPLRGRYAAVAWQVRGILRIHCSSSCQHFPVFNLFFLTEGYSLRALTEPIDRLNAFAGITRYFAQTTDNAPLVGLWEQNLISAVLWRYAPTELRGTHEKDFGPSTILAPTQLGIPSWSWLQRFCPIKSFPWSEFQGKEYGPSMVSPCVTFRQCIVNWSGEELSSKITRAELHGLGRFSQVSLRRDPDPSSISEKPGIYITAGGLGSFMPRAISRAFLDADWTQESLPTGKVCCLRIMTCNGREYILLVKRKEMDSGPVRIIREVLP